MTDSSTIPTVLFHMRQMDEYEFEHLVAKIWEEEGWNTQVTSGSGDRGIDVKATKSDPLSRKALIQAKRYGQDNKVGSPEIQKYASLYIQEKNVDTVVVVTTSSFSSQAKQVADSTNVELINGESLATKFIELVRQQKIQRNNNKNSNDTSPQSTIGSSETTSHENNDSQSATTRSTTQSKKEVQHQSDTSSPRSEINENKSSKVSKKTPATSGNDNIDPQSVAGSDAKSTSEKWYNIEGVYEMLIFLVICYGLGSYGYMAEGPLLLSGFFGHAFGIFSIILFITSACALSVVIVNNK